MCSLGFTILKTYANIHSAVKSTGQFMLLVRHTIKSVKRNGSDPRPSSNTVTYSLISACATCQGGYFQSFAIWTENCPSDLIIRQRFAVTLENTHLLTLKMFWFSFPNRTKLSIDIPAYACLPLTPDGLFDIKAASSSCMRATSLTSR